MLMHPIPARLSVLYRRFTFQYSTFTTLPKTILLISLQITFTVKSQQQVKWRIGHQETQLVSLTGKQSSSQRVKLSGQTHRRTALTVIPAKLFLLPRCSRVLHSCVPAVLSLILITHARETAVISPSPQCKTPVVTSMNFAWPAYITASCLNRKERRAVSRRQLNFSVFTQNQDTKYAQSLRRSARYRDTVRRISTEKINDVSYVIAGRAQKTSGACEPRQACQPTASSSRHI